jgi:hypothetical protein
MERFRAVALVLTFLWSTVLGPATVSAQLDFDAVLAKRRPSPEEIEVERLLAEAQRISAGSRGVAAEGPTTSIAGGPRDKDGSEDDLSLQVEMPLLSARSERRALGEMLPTAGAAAKTAAGAVADAELADAFVAAWLADAIAHVRALDLATVEAWLDASRRRTEAGADPPYEPILVGGERDRALVESIEAHREVELAWGELRARADVPQRPEPVALGALPGYATTPDITTSSPGDVMKAGIEARRNVAIAVARVQTARASSRWGLAGEVAAEGGERLAHVGVAYRLPLRGERSAIAAEQSAAETAANREAERRLVEVEAQVSAAAATLAWAGQVLDSSALDAAQAALTARLEEGKERPSEILPLRRQLLEARIAALRSRAARIAAEAKLFFLAEGK